MGILEWNFSSDCEINRKLRGEKGEIPIHSPPPGVLRLSQTIEHCQIDSGVRLNTWKWISNALGQVYTASSNQFHSLSPPEVADPTPFPVQAEVTMKTNFFGTRDVCTELLPLIKPQGESGGRSPGLLLSFCARTGARLSATGGVALLLVSILLWLQILSLHVLVKCPLRFHILSLEGLLGFHSSLKHFTHQLGPYLQVTMPSPYKTSDYAP